MTLDNEPDVQAAGRDSWASPARLALLGFAVQAVGALVIWTVVDDSSGRTWATGDFREWMTFSIVLAVLVAALVGAATRRWRTTLAVVMGCLLAMALGWAVLVGYAVVNSA